MKFVNVKELKNSTSEILHYTEKGKDIIVTLRGKPTRNILMEKLQTSITISKRRKKNLEEFKVILTDVAQKDLDGIDPSLRLRILEKIKELNLDPFPRGDTVKRLKGVKFPLYRLRAGDSRCLSRG